MRKYIKKVSYIVLVIVIFEFIFISGVSVYANTKPKVTYNVSGELEVGNTVTITISLSNVNKLYGSSIDFIYDPNIIQVLDVNKGEILGKSVKMPVAKVENGQVNIVSLLTGNSIGISGSGTLATMKVKILKPGKISFSTTSSNNKLSLTDNTIRVKLSNSNGEPIYYEKEDKGFEIHGTKVLDSELISENIPEVMEPGKSYSITLKFKNTGRENWTSDMNHRLGLDYVPNSLYGEFNLKGRYYLEMDEVIKPGEVAEFNLMMKAPLKEGEYSLNFKMLKEGKVWFGEMLSKKIIISSNPIKEELNAELVSIDIPQEMNSGDTYVAHLKIKNTGTETWSNLENHRLGLDYTEESQYSSFSLGRRIDLDKNILVKPNESILLKVPLKAPSESGIYTLNFKMLKEGKRWFGPTITKKVKVKNPVLLGAQLVYENIPTVMEPDHLYNVQLEFKNIGSESWTKKSKHRLGLDYIENSKYGLFGIGGRIDLGEDSIVKPGETAKFTTVLKAPNNSGTYNLNFKMLKEGVAWFGPTIEKSITVGKAKFGAEVVSENIPTMMEPGYEYDVYLKIKNTGTHPWTANGNYRLGLDYISGSSYGSFGLPGRVRLDSNIIVNPGDVYKFKFTLKAPNNSGTYNLNFKMLKEGVAWFGPTISKKIKVDKANFDSQIISYDIPNSMKIGEIYNASISIKNTGTHPWMANGKYRLGLDYISESDHSEFGLARRVDLNSDIIINPGDINEFKFILKAPNNSGIYNLNFKMLKEGTAWFGPTLSRKIYIEN